MNQTIKLGWCTTFLALLLVACNNNTETSSTTGWAYNDQKWGGFEKADYEGQATGPNLVLIKGGTFTMGLTDQDVTYEWNNIPRRVTVSSFYMDETEVRNIDYQEYLFWLARVYGDTYPEVGRRALPDSLVWRDELSYNEPMVEHYFRAPDFYQYPVVGVSWHQANNFCAWRTDRVNEMILIKRGIIAATQDQKNENNFNTEAYLAGQYEPDVRKSLPDIRTGNDRRVRLEDGILLPAYRLPTEAEWEFAALGLLGNQAISVEELITDHRIYPWNGNTVRYERRDKNMGKIMANFKRSHGDYGGTAGALNDNAFYTAEVVSGWPNDYGLYNMAGNVNEWTADLYRPMTSADLEDTGNEDLNSYRGNRFMTKKVDPETGAPVAKDSLGHLLYELMDTTSTALRDNYKRPEVFNFLDGDKESQVEYFFGKSTLISDSTRVIKGGSWADRAFWLAPGTRRYLDENKASKTVGFRCAMVRKGPVMGNGERDGNYFGERHKKASRRYDKGSALTGNNITKKLSNGRSSMLKKLTEKPKLNVNVQH
jgi:gliding motility-associated lipoprotein GldJ